MMFWKKRIQRQENGKRVVTAYCDAQIILGHQTRRCTCYDTKKFAAWSKTSLSQGEPCDMRVYRGIKSIVRKGSCNSSARESVGEQHCASTTRTNGLYRWQICRCTKKLDPYEKGAYAIVQKFDRMDYVLWPAHQVLVFTDHRNIFFIFAPLALRLEFLQACVILSL